MTSEPFNQDLYYAFRPGDHNLRSLRTSAYDRLPMDEADAKARWMEQFGNPEYMLVKIVPIARRRVAKPTVTFEEFQR